MNIIALDFETYFDNEYTLSKLTTEEYVRDPRFETHGVGIRDANGDAAWYGGDEVADLFIDWPNTIVLCHHAQFDGFILSERYGIKPGGWLDTFSMARYVLGTHSRLSLDALTKRFGIQGKTIDYSHGSGFKGLHWHEMSKAQQDNLSNGCLDDLEATWQLFNILAKTFPAVEYPIVDLTIRIFTEPKLVGDTAQFAKVRDDDYLRKNELLYELGVGEKDLASNDKFVALLESMGVDVDMKMSAPTKTYPTGRLVPAVAKSDPFMQDLLDDQDETLATLARARIETKSTINETRAGRLHDMSTRGPLAVYLNYAGAATRRWSGGDSTNFQNLGRDGKLRKGVCAPEGFLIAAPDQSQGECRLLNWLAGQTDVVERFARGEDVYLPTASRFFCREITRADKDERQMGKGIELGCGFGMGHLKLYNTLLRDPKIADAIKRGALTLTIADAERAVGIYRDDHPMVKALWVEAKRVLVSLGNKEAFTWRIFSSPGDGKIYHPNGGWLDYSTLEYHANEAGERNWRVRSRDGWKKMYGSKLVENLVQWMSRIVTAEAMVKFRDAGYPVVGMSHDDVWLLVWLHGNMSVKDHEQFIIETMAATPSWAPGLPLGAECKLGSTYG